MDKLLAFFENRLHALVDKSAWMLIAPALVALFLIDTAMAKTLVQWSLYAVVLAGLGIIISRLTFPQINLSEHVDEARKGNVAAALVVLAIVSFVAIVLYSMVTWAKA